MNVKYLRIKSDDTRLVLLALEKCLHEASTIPNMTELKNKPKGGSRAASMIYFATEYEYLSVRFFLAANLISGKSVVDTEERTPVQVHCIGIGI